MVSWVFVGVAREVEAVAAPVIWNLLISIPQLVYVYASIQVNYRSELTRSITFSICVTVSWPKAVRQQVQITLSPPYLYMLSDVCSSSCLSILQPTHAHNATIEWPLCMTTWNNMLLLPMGEWVSSLFLIVGDLLLPTFLALKGQHLASWTSSIKFQLHAPHMLHPSHPMPNFPDNHSTHTSTQGRSLKTMLSDTISDFSFHSDASLPGLWYGEVSSPTARVCPTLIPSNNSPSPEATHPS